MGSELAPPSSLSLGLDTLPATSEIRSTLEKVTQFDTNATKNHQYTQDVKRQVQYCRAHLKETLELNDTAQKDYNFCRSLRSNDDAFSRILNDINLE